MKHRGLQLIKVSPSQETLINCTPRCLPYLNTCERPLSPETTLYPILIQVRELTSRKSKTRQIRFSNTKIQNQITTAL